METEIEQDCINCNWAVRIVDGQNKILYYQCHFNPPNVSVYQDLDRHYLLQINTHYPRVAEGDWCSQFKINEELLLPPPHP